MITSGAIEALELIGKSFLDPGDTVAVEGPTYLGAIQAFRSFEAMLVAVPLDEHGLEVDELERQLGAGLRPKLVYTIPDHQNPAGVSLAAEGVRRWSSLALVRIPDRRGRRLPRARLRQGDAAEPLEPRPRRRRPGGHDVEDVLPRCPARLGGRTGRDLRAARRRKAADRPVRRRARAASLRGVGPPRLDRGAADALARALPRKGERMLAALGRSLPEGARWTTPQGGFFSWLTPRHGIRRAGSAGGRAGRRDRSGTLFYPDGRGADEVRLSFSLVDEARIDEGIEKLGGPCGEGDALPLGRTAEGGPEAGSGATADRDRADDAGAGLPRAGLHRPAALPRERAADVHPRGQAALLARRGRVGGRGRRRARFSTSHRGCRTRRKRSRRHWMWTSSPAAAGLARRLDAYLRTK